MVSFISHMHPPLIKAIVCVKAVIELLSGLAEYCPSGISHVVNPGMSRDGKYHKIWKIGKYWGI